MAKRQTGYRVVVCILTFVQCLWLPRAMASDPAASHRGGAVHSRPSYVTALEAAYGEPATTGFGSAVFFEMSAVTEDLPTAALAKYRYFVGTSWDRYGESAWLGPWKQVYMRASDARHDIVAELRGIGDVDARNSTSMILDNVDDAPSARAALSGAFDHPAVTELRVFNLGDGQSMSGLLVAARRGSTGETTFLVFLLD